MFRRKPQTSQNNTPPPVQRITSVVADGVSLRGKLSGAGGVRIEGAFDGEIELDGLFVIGPTGRVTCPKLKARHVIVAGAMRGDILAARVEIRAGGRVWGNVTAESMATEEGAFLRGQIQMEEKLELGITAPRPVDEGEPEALAAPEEAPPVEPAPSAPAASTPPAAPTSGPKFKRKSK